MDFEAACLQACTFRIVISLGIFLIPFAPRYIRAILLIYVTDFLDGLFFRLWYPIEKDHINASYAYHLTDKIADFISNLLGIILLCPDPVVSVMLMWRLLGIIVFTQIKSSWIWVIFPDLTKELLIVKYLFGPITPLVLFLVFIAKATYEYYHHFIANKRTFDSSV